MIRLREFAACEGRESAARRHMDQAAVGRDRRRLDHPVRAREAAEFRDSLDKLIAAYDQAMSEAHQVPVKA